VNIGLRGRRDLGDGDVDRAIRAAQRKHFDPPQFDERVQPIPAGWVCGRKGPSGRRVVAHALFFAGPALPRPFFGQVI
jgi:hypothetical protein